MSELYAKPIIDNKFWIIEQNGVKFATLRKDDEDKFILSNNNGVEIFKNKKNIIEKFGKDFFVSNVIKSNSDEPIKEVYGFPCSTTPYNCMFDVKRKLPLFTKSQDSKSIFCAGYYVVRFDKTWAKGFCPKLITLQRYEYQGPYKTEIETKQVLSNAKKQHND